MNLRSLATLSLLCGCVAACAYRPPTYDVPPILANREDVARQLQSVGATLEAQVIIQVQVDREGNVHDVRVIQGSGDRHIDALAVWAGKQMRFSPARHRGQPVEASVRVPVTFALPPEIRQQPVLLNDLAIRELMGSDHGELRGKVRVNARVGPLGAVRDSREAVAESIELREAVTALLPQLRFTPALSDDGAVSAWIVLVFEFAGPESVVRIDKATDEV